MPRILAWNHSCFPRPSSNSEIRDLTFAHQNSNHTISIHRRRHAPRPSLKEKLACCLPQLHQQLLRVFQQCSLKEPQRKILLEPLQDDDILPIHRVGGLPPFALVLPRKAGEHPPHLLDLRLPPLPIAISIVGDLPTEFHMDSQKQTNSPNGRFVTPSIEGSYGGWLHLLPKQVRSLVEIC